MRVLAFCPAAIESWRDRRPRDPLFPQKYTCIMHRLTLGSGSTDREDAIPPISPITLKILVNPSVPIAITSQTQHLLYPYTYSYDCSCLSRWFPS